MPYSSSVFTKLASEYLGGGCVKCCSPYISLIGISSLMANSGNLASFSSSLSSAPSR